MAFGFGVGDILVLTHMIVDTIQNIHDAPKELQELANRVESVEATLDSLDELSYSSAAANTRKLERKIGRVKEVLDKMHEIVSKYRDNQGRVNPFNRAMFGVWDKRGVGELGVKLEERTKDLTSFLIVQTLQLTNQIRPLIDQILSRIPQEQARAKDQSAAGDTTAARRSGSPHDAKIQTPISNQIDQVQTVLEHVLQTERLSDPILLSGQEDVSIEREIETQLGEAGIGAKFTKALIEIIDKQGKQLVHPEDIDPLSYTGGKNTLETPKGWIMVVDSYNEVRSIIAQTYLELVRVWTLNNSGEWIFNRVESAGVLVETKFARRSLKSQLGSMVKGGNAPESAALKAISGKESYFRSEEKTDILARIAKHRSRGIDNWHFRKYEYMLCCDKTVCETLGTLRKCCKKRYGHLPSYAHLSEIVLLKDIKLKDAATNLNATDTGRLVETLKDAIKNFLDTKYHWRRPPSSIIEGPFRTKQIVLPNIDMKHSLDEIKAKVSGISKRTDCRIRVTDEKFDSQLFSITGRKEALPFASSLLKEALL